MEKISQTRIIYTLSLAIIANYPLSAQEAATDTTTLGYKVGYQVGSWLPFLIIITLIVLIILKSARQSRE